MLNLGQWDPLSSGSLRPNPALSQWLEAGEQTRPNEDCTLCPQLSNAEQHGKLGAGPDGHVIAAMTLSLSLLVTRGG
eukprot:5448095-Amphidinium_carterae.1